MALDGVFRMKGATAKDINEVACNVIESEKKYLPAPRIGAVPEIDALKIRRQWIAAKPNQRHELSVMDRLVYGANGKKNLLDLYKCAKHQAGPKDQNSSLRKYFTDPDDPQMVELRERCDQKLAQQRQSKMDRYCLPMTSSGEIGRLAIRPLDPKWRRSEGPGMQWRFPKDECDIVLFGKKFYECTGVNCFSKAASAGIFNGIPS